MDVTRLLHTADLHLADDRPERWTALDAVLRAAEERDVDAILVAGDLLDRGEDHAALRARVRERLDDAPAPVLVLPGNHDLEAYAPGQDWGARTRLLLEEPVHAVRVGGVRIVGVPFPSRHVPFAAVRERVVDAIEPGEPNVLALHGTLVDADAPHIQAESRDDEPDDRYFSVRTGELEGIGAAYVALGHYHQHDLRRAGSTPVAYAGSPSPVGAHAWGRRSVVLARIGSGPADVEAVPLPVPYRERIVRWLTPFREAEELDELAGELGERADPACSMRVELSGILAGIDEQQLSDAVGEMEASLGEEFEALSFDRDAVGLDPGRARLFREFRRRLEAREDGDAGIGDRLRHRTLEIAARALKR